MIASRNPEDIRLSSVEARSRRANSLFHCWYVYILLCKDNSLYTGITNNLEARVHKHNRGIACRYTSARTPVELVHFEKFPDKSEARKREMQLKGWTREKKQLLIKGIGFK